MFTIETYLYVAERWIDSMGKEPMKRDLQSHGWTVKSIEVTPANGWSGLGGILAEHMPTTIVMERLGATKAAAEEAVSDAITRTGNYSVGQSIIVTVAEVGSGDAFEEDGRFAGLPSVVKLGLGVVLAGIVLAGIIYAAPLVREGLKTARQVRGKA